MKLWVGWSPNLHLITYNQAPAQSLWLSLLPLQDGLTYLVVQLLDAPGVACFSCQGPSWALPAWDELSSTQTCLLKLQLSHLSWSYRKLPNSGWGGGLFFSPWISTPSAAWHPANIADVPHEYCIRCPNMKNYAAPKAASPVRSSWFLNPWVMFPELGFLVPESTLHQRDDVRWTLFSHRSCVQAWNLWPCLCKQLMMQTHFITFQLTFTANPAGWDQIKPSWTRGGIVRAQLIFPAELFQATEWRARNCCWFMDTVPALLKFFQLQMRSTWSGWGHRIPAETHVGQTSEGHTSQRAAGKDSSEAHF